MPRGIPGTGRYSRRKKATKPAAAAEPKPKVSLLDGLTDTLEKEMERLGAEQSVLEERLKANLVEYNRTRAAWEALRGTQEIPEEMKFGT